MCERGARLVVLSFVLALLLGCSGPSRPQQGGATPRLSVADWRGAFDDSEEALWDRSERESRSSDSWDHYDLAYGIDGYTSMFEATGERRYVDRAMTLALNMVEAARPAREPYRDGYLGWVSRRSDVRGEEVPLFESYCWRYVTRMLRVVREAGLLSDEEVRRRWSLLLEFAERNVFEKWFVRGVEQNMFRDRTHMASHWAFIAAELRVLTSDETRRQQYDDVVSAIDRGMTNQPGSLRTVLQPAPDDPAAYVWSSRWDEDAASPQDVDHGNGVVSYIVEARDTGTEWTDEDLARLSATLVEVVLRDDGTSAEYVDGSGDGTGWLSDGFVKLGRTNPAVQAVLERHEPQNEQFVAAMALNARRLADRPGG